MLCSVLKTRKFIPRLACAVRSMAVTRKRSTPTKARPQADSQDIEGVATDTLQALKIESPEKRIRKSPTKPKKADSPTKPDSADHHSSEQRVSEPAERNRCAWSTTYTGASETRYVRYHDEEWGVPCVDDQRLMECAHACPLHNATLNDRYIVLDGAQCGLSWSTILSKRDAYTEAFHRWDIQRMASMGDKDVEHLLSPESGIVRHKGKILSAIHNAQLVLGIQKEYGSLAAYLWGMMPNKAPINNTYKTMKEVPAKTELAEEISKKLKKRGFKFVGPTMVYAFMQAAGFVNDHTVDCFRYQAIVEMHKTFEAPEHIVSI